MMAPIKVSWVTFAASLLLCLPGFSQDPILYHIGMCDASAGVALQQNSFVVANDEDNILRIYQAEQSGAPLAQIDLTEFLQVDREHPESDLEGAARVGDRIYWITSHGRNKDAKFRESRHRFFATRIQRVGGAQLSRLVPEGRPYKFLQRDLLREPRLFPFNLAVASSRAPKDSAAFNIEGLSATSGQHLLIGFRNPIPGGKALLVPLLNPDQVITGRPAKFGEPILLPLGGLGIRDIIWHRGQHYLVGGSYDGGGTGSRLFRWAGPGQPPELCSAMVYQDRNPEAIVAYPESPFRLQMLSDDGTLNVGGKDCKDLKDASKKRFRSFRVNLPSEETARP